MEKTPRFWLNIRERYCHKKTPTILGERSQYEQTLPFFYATFVSRTLALSGMTLALKSVQSNLYVPLIC